MRLIENKGDIMFHKVINRIYFGEGNIQNSNYLMEYKQEIWIDDLITSNYLMLNIGNEINGE